MDFLTSYPFGYNFPVFNVADICQYRSIFSVNLRFSSFIKSREEDKVSEDTQEVSGSDEK